MDIDYRDKDLDRLEQDAKYTNGLAPAVVKAFRKRIQQIRAAVDERDLRKLKSLHFEKLKGSKKGERSIRLNDQYRLVVNLEQDGKTQKLVVVEIADYH